MTQIQKRQMKLEQTAQQPIRELDYRKSVQAIRMGLESAERGEGIPADELFARLRYKYKVSMSR